MKTILTKLAKCFMPSAETISKFAAERIASTINSSGKEELIAKYAKAGEYLTQVQQMLADGKVSDEETETIALMLQPTVKKLLELL